MLYANDEIFSIDYNENVDRQQIKRKKQGRIKRAIHENKIFAILVVLFAMFCSFNCVLIYTFMNLLTNL